MGRDREHQPYSQGQSAEDIIEILTCWLMMREQVSR